MRYRTYCPKAFASNGRNALPATWLSRSIEIFLLRASRAQQATVTEWETDDAEAEADRLKLADRLEAFELNYERPASRPEQLGARDKAKWLPLLEIAAVAGGRWRQRIWKAAIALGCEPTGEPEDDVVLLLADLKAVWDQDGRDGKIFSRDLYSGLLALEDPAYYGSATASKESLRAFLVGHFRIHPEPQTIRIGRGERAPVGRGYLRSRFEPIFESYLAGG